MVGGPNEPYPLPDDPALAQVCAALNAAGHYGVVVDDGWNVVYATDELRLTFGGNLELVEFALGKHLYSPEAVALRATYPLGPNTLELQRLGFASFGNLMLADTPGGKAQLRRLVDPVLHDLIDTFEPADVETVAYTGASGGGAIDRRVDIRSIAIRIRDRTGRLRGTATIQKPALGMTAIAAMVASGDLGHFERMQQVARPDRRPAALLFADLESSTPLSRRLSTANYFAFARRFTRVADACVIAAGGLVGRHAGDGVVAFFLAEQLGSESAAVRSCIEAARSLRMAVPEVASRSGIDADEVVLRFGLHWGATIYVGNLTTNGRAEVTALGDEVNEAARIEACASGGRALASKTLVERLDSDDAAALGIDPDRIVYTPLAALPTATDKARRDAPGIAVYDLDEP